MPHTFSTKVLKIESNVKGTFNPCVVVPHEIVSSLLIAAEKKSPPIPVKISLNGKDFDANLVRYAGAYRLYLNTEMRQAAKVAVGDDVKISLQLDREKRTLPVPRELKTALAENKKANSVWQRLPPSHQKEYLAYLNSLKSKEALDRNVKKTIQMLLNQK